MRILLTGATGFVGSIAAQALESSGHSVRAALRTPREGLTFESLVVGDVGPDTDWRRSLVDVDVVVHLAARVHVMRDQVDNADEFGASILRVRCALHAQPQWPARVGSSSLVR